jgi:hypothetical protein
MLKTNLFTKTGSGQMGKVEQTRFCRVKGARTAHSLEIDYLGVWNEAPSDANYVKMLRKTLDSAGFGKTIIVGHDASPDICSDMLKDQEYMDAVGVIGLHCEHLPFELST